VLLSPSTGGDRGVCPSRSSVLPGLAITSASGAGPAPPAHTVGRAGGEGVCGAGLSQAKKATPAGGGPPLPHPVPEGLPGLARELYGGLTERQIPGTPARHRPEEPRPQQVAVLVKRAEGKGEDPGRRGSSWRGLPGRRAVKVGRGALEWRDRLRRRVQIDVNRQDLQPRPPERIKPPRLPGLPQPTSSPVVFDRRRSRHRGREAEEERRPQAPSARGPTAPGLHTEQCSP